jgi:hypothetical protein
VILGTVSADGVPMVALSLAGRDWSAIIDTGFNGDPGTGTHLLRKYCLQINFVAKTVQLEKV